MTSENNDAVLLQEAFERTKLRYANHLRIIHDYLLLHGSLVVGLPKGFQPTATQNFAFRFEFDMTSQQINFMLDSQLRSLIGWWVVDATIVLFPDTLGILLACSPLPNRASTDFWSKGTSPSGGLFLSWPRDSKGKLEEMPVFPSVLEGTMFSV